MLFTVHHLRKAFNLNKTPDILVWIGVPSLPRATGAAEQ